MRKVRGYRISHYIFHFSVAVLSSRTSALRWRLLIIRLIRQEHKPPVPGPIIGSKYGTLTELGPDSTCAFVGPLRARPARTHPPHRNIPYHTCTARRRWRLRYRTMVVGGGWAPVRLLHWIMVPISILLALCSRIYLYDGTLL